MQPSVRRAGRHPQLRPPRRIVAQGATVLLSGVLAAVALGCGQGDRTGPDGAATGSSSTTAETSEGTIDAAGAEDPDDLVDGEHQVVVDSVDEAAGTVAVDGLQVLEGAEAVLAYLADTDGAQLEGPQIYVRNANPELQSLPVDPDGEFSVVFATRCCEPSDLGWHGFAELASSGFPDVWGVAPPFNATIVDGRVTSLVQIYVP